MPDLTLRKVPFTAESDNRLRMLKGRTGLDRNYLCRMGFCLSLEEPGVPTVQTEKLKGIREIDRYTLLGQHAQTYVALLLVWIKENDIALPLSHEVDTVFIAHMNRGVEIMASRVRNLGDLGGLLPRGPSDE